MKINPSPPVIITIAAVVVIILIIVMVMHNNYASNTPAAGSSASLSAQVTQILQRTHGDLNQMTPEEKTIYNQALQKGQVPAGLPGAAPVPPGRMNPASLP